MKYVILATLLLFEPIIIDEPTYQSILQAAHSNFRGTEYDMLAQMLGRLEQNAERTKQTPEPKK